MIFGQPSSTDRQYEGWLTIASYLSLWRYHAVSYVQTMHELANSYAGRSAVTDIKIKSLEDYNALGYDENIIPGYTAYVARKPRLLGQRRQRLHSLDGKADQTFTGAGLTRCRCRLYSEGQGIVQSYFSKVAAGAGTTQLVDRRI